MNETDDRSWINAWLSPGEQVLWRGKPEKYSLFKKTDLFMIPFSLLWCGFAVFWEYTVVSHPTPLFFRLWGIPFVCAGLYFVIGRFFFRSWQLRHAAYAVTDQKILRKVGKKVDVLLRESLPPMQIEQREDGSGTIRFPLPNGYWRSPFNQTASASAFSLEGLTDLRRAVSAIEAMRAGGD